MKCDQESCADSVCTVFSSSKGIPHPDQLKILSFLREKKELARNI